MKKHMSRSTLVMVLLDIVLGVVLSLYIANTDTMPAADNAATYTDGTYTASADGIGKVTVTATFDANAITAIDLDVSNETEAIGGKAKDELVKQMMAAQGGDIDGVSGATITADAAQSALKKCIAQAKGEAAADAGASAVVPTNGSSVATDILSEDVANSAVVLAEI